MAIKFLMESVKEQVSQIAFLLYKILVVDACSDITKMMDCQLLKVVKATLDTVSMLIQWEDAFLAVLAPH